MIDRSRLSAFSAEEPKTSERKHIEPGNYVVKILRVQIQYAKWDTNTELLHVDYDIATGEYANYWREDYNSRSTDKRLVVDWRGTIDIPIYSDAFARFLAAVEVSNDGFKFESDEQTLVGKFVGFKFRREEYVDKTSLETKSIVKPYKYSFATVQDVQAGKVKVLGDYTLEAQEKYKAKKGGTSVKQPAVQQPPAQYAPKQQQAVPTYIPQQYQQPQKPPKFESALSSEDELPF